jgi:TolB-like protein/Tfp pilus assembly protein PilF
VAGETVVGDLVRFGPFEFDPHSLELTRAGRVVKLAPQPARLLGTLVERAGRLVTRDELRQALWGDDTFVDVDAGLNYCLGRLRAVLGDDVQAPRFIETVPRRGHRFVAEVERPRRTHSTLAVLPFDNLGGDPADEYLSDGVADGLITELSKIPSLRVISRQSVLALKGSRLPMADIARKLQADTIVEGNVLHHGGRLRITAQLIGANPERHLWAQSYEGDPKDFLTLLNGVARAVAGAIHVVLAPEDEVRLRDGSGSAGSHQPRPEAQMAFLKARFHLGKWSGVEIQKGLACLRESITLDPGYAPAYAALANCLMMLGYWGHQPWQQVYPQARQAAMRAVELDPALSDAHVGQAWVRLCYDWDFAGAETSARRAVETAPSNEMAHMALGLCRSWVNDDQDTAVACATTALAIDPISPFTNSSAAWLLMFARRFEDAARQAEETLRMYPDALQAVMVLAWTRVAEGRLADALGMFEQAAAASPDPITLGFVGHLYGRMGREVEARAIIDRLTTGDQSGHVPVKSLVSVYAGLGDADRAFEWLDRGLGMRDGGLVALRVSPPFEPLKCDPRFEKLAARIGLQPSAPA